MKPSRLASLSLAASLALPVLAHAHPGHDGDHDFTWDFDHVVSHPLATLACLAVLGAAAWLVWRSARSRPAPRRERDKRD